MVTSVISAQHYQILRNIGAFKILKPKGPLMKQILLVPFWYATSLFQKSGNNILKILNDLSSIQGQDLNYFCWIEMILNIPGLFR